MRAVLEWFGDASSVVALEALLVGGTDVALRPVALSPALADFMLLDQAAALSLPVVDVPPTVAPTPRDDVHVELVARGYRAVVVACRPPLDAAFLGRVLDAQALRDAQRQGAGPGAFDAFVFDGPRFRRRVDLVALDAELADDEWRLPLGLRGC